MSWDTSCRSESSLALSSRAASPRSRCSASLASTAASCSASSRRSS